MMLRRLAHCLLLGLWLAGCAFMPATPSVTPPATPSVTPMSALASPEVQLPAAPAELCREATQLRLEPLLKGPWPAGAVATWQLTSVDSETALTAGEWTPIQRDLLIAFPQGAPLPPGDYRVTLHTDTAVLMTHRFTILTDEPQFRELELRLTPDGPLVERLPDDTRVFYVAYRYAGVCAGTPLWLSVSDGAEVVCTQTLALPAMRGQGVTACYREQGAPFAAGDYRATLTLNAPERWTLDFGVGTPPQPPQLPPTYATRCEAPFVAAALDPQGAPLLPGDRFQWYTQAVYVGAACYETPPNTPWTAQWYREGALVREFEGVWDGALTGVIWDSLVGTPQAPFLRAGAYAVTLTISNTTLLTTTFRVVAYIPPATNP